MRQNQNKKINRKARSPKRVQSKSKSLAKSEEEEVQGHPSGQRAGLGASLRRRAVEVGQRRSTNQRRREGAQSKAEQREEGAQGKQNGERKGPRASRTARERAQCKQR